MIYGIILQGKMGVSMDKGSGIKPSHEEVLREIFDAWVESMHAPSLYDEFGSWKAGYEAGAAAEREALKGNAEPVAWKGARYDLELHEVSLSRTLDKSACSNYGLNTTVYKGWLNAAAPRNDQE